MIQFKYIEYQNFRTAGNAPIRIDFDKSKTTLITGKNGHGKSTVIHAMCYNLFNRGYGDDLNLPQLINSINQKKCLTTCEFISGSKHYKVVRGMKPKVFEIYEDGILLNQEASTRDYQAVLENQILKFNYRSFTQVVVIGGSDYKPFMKLKLDERRKFIEDLLDIRVFSSMNDILKVRNKEIREELGVINAEIKATEASIESQQSFISTLEREKGDSVSRVRDSIERLEDECREFSVSQSTLLDTVEKYRKQLKPFSTLKEKSISLKMELKQLQNEQKKLIEHVEFFNTIDTCPTCEQDINHTHKDNIFEKYGADIDSINADIIKLTHDIEELQVKVLLHDKIVSKVDSLEQELITTNAHIKSNLRQIKQHQQEISNMENDTNSVDEEKSKLDIAIQKMDSLDKKKTSLLNQQQEYQFVGEILADGGIKARIIKTYIPTINHLINKYLNEMEFFVSFNLDEAFNEVIKSRYRDTFTYGCFSDGQKARIDLALMFAWREMARLRNAVNCNICFFDEADKAIDIEGASLFSDLIKKVNIENVFVISHKNEAIMDKYSRCLNMELVNNFTVLTE